MYIGYLKENWTFNCVNVDEIRRYEACTTVSKAEGVIKNKANVTFPKSIDWLTNIYWLIMY